MALRSLLEARKAQPKEPVHFQEGLKRCHGCGCVLATDTRTRCQACVIYRRTAQALRKNDRRRQDLQRLTTYRILEQPMLANDELDVID